MIKLPVPGLDIPIPQRQQATENAPTDGQWARLLEHLGGDQGRGPNPADAGLAGHGQLEGFAENGQQEGFGNTAGFDRTFNPFVPVKKTDGELFAELVPYRLMATGRLSQVDTARTLALQSYARHTPAAAEGPASPAGAPDIRTALARVDHGGDNKVWNRQLAQTVADQARDTRDSLLRSRSTDRSVDWSRAADTDWLSRRLHIVEREGHWKIWLRDYRLSDEQAETLANAVRQMAGDNRRTVESIHINGRAFPVTAR